MRFGKTSVAVAMVALSACGGGGPSGPPALAYQVPSQASLQYVTGDTINLDIDAGGQSMQATVRTSATLGTVFSRAADGVQVTMTVDDMSGRAANPMATATADESGVDGPLVFTMDRRGAVTVVSQPTVSEAAGQFFQALGVAHGFFPRLPGRGAGMGERWSDTIRVDGPQGEGTVKQVSVVDYTIAGDTVVSGRSLVRIDVTGTSETSAKGVTTGMDFTQTLSGTMEGWVLWDMQRGIMVESYTASDARGTMEVAAAPFPLGVRLRGQSRVKLNEGM